MLTAWQQAIVAAVFELCLVGVMVIFELLGQGRAPLPAATGAVGTAERPTIETPPPAKRTAGRRKPLKPDSVSAFAQERLFPADGAQRTEMKALMAVYRAWCAHKGQTPMPLEEFMDRIEKLCRKIGVEIEVGDDQRVYLLNVRLDGRATAAPATAH